MLLRTVLVTCVVAGLLAIGAAAQPPEVRRIVGTEVAYVISEGDSLASLGARFGVEPSALARMNGLGANARLRPEEILHLDNRHVVPAALAEGLVINIPQRLLFLFSKGALVAWYPIGVGLPDWPTPTGPFSVIGKEVDPVWDVPPSIQEEMRRNGKDVVTRILPGPRNPLGRYWIALTHQNLGIHGTNAPTSVYRFQSHGCIRLHPDDIADLFPRVEIGTPGEIVYEPLLLARGVDGRLYLEVHRDVYSRMGDPATTLTTAVERIGARADIDWDRALEALRTHDGVVRDVSGWRSSAHRD